MLALAEESADKPALLRTIAEGEGLSRKYLFALFASLRGAGLVRSKRGRNGGYSLARPASEITVSEVVRTLEGSLSLVDCVDDNGICESSEHCIIREVWQKVSEAISDTLAGMTLEDLVRRRKLREPPSPGCR